MLLAIDCGNTNTVFAIWDGARFLGTWRIATDHRRTADEYFVWLSSLMLLTKVEATITEAIISSTVPRVVRRARYGWAVPFTWVKEPPTIALPGVAPRASIRIVVRPPSE